MPIAVNRSPARGLARSRAALVAVSALLASGTAVAQPIPADGRELLGVYAGSYVCQDGEHGFFLRLDTVSPVAGGGFAADGALGVFPVLAGRDGGAGSVAGSFIVAGTVTAEGRVDLGPGDWLIQPQNYGAAHLQGELSQRPDGLWQILGRPVIPGNEDYCSDLIATRFLP